MNTMKYQAFLEVVDCGNLTKAAEKLNYSQPAVSHMIRTMEEEYGFPLLRRTPHKVLPTPEALRILPQIREIVYNENFIFEEINRIKNIEVGKINLGAYNSAMMTFLPKLIENFSIKHPAIEITLVEGNRTEIDVFLKTRGADFAVVSQFDYPEYEFIPLMNDELMAVLPREHPLTKKKKIRPEELFQYPILATEESSDQDLVEICRVHGIAANIKMRAKQESSLLKLVACNMGVSIIPNLYLERLDPALEIRPLDSPYQHRTIGIAAISIEGLSPACQEFIHMIPQDINTLWKNSGN